MQVASPPLIGPIMSEITEGNLTLETGKNMNGKTLLDREQRMEIQTCWTSPLTPLLLSRMDAGNEITAVIVGEVLTKIYKNLQYPFGRLRYIENAMRRETCQDIYYTACDIINLEQVIKNSEEWNIFQTPTRNDRIRTALSNVRELTGMGNGYNFEKFEDSYRSNKELSELLKWELNTIKTLWGLLYDEYCNLKRCWVKIFENKEKIRILRQPELKVNEAKTDNNLGFIRIGDQWWKTAKSQGKTYYDKEGEWRLVEADGDVILLE